MDILKTVKTNIAAYTKALKAYNSAKRESTKAQKSEKLKIAQLNLINCLSEGINYIQSVDQDEVKIESIVEAAVEIQSIAKDEVKVESIVEVAAEIQSVDQDEVKVESMVEAAAEIQYNGLLAWDKIKERTLNDKTVAICHLEDSTITAIKRVKEAIKVTKRLPVYIEKAKSVREQKSISFLIDFLSHKSSDLNSNWYQTGWFKLDYSARTTIIDVINEMATKIRQNSFTSNGDIARIAYKVGYYGVKVGTYNTERKTSSSKGQNKWEVIQNIQSVFENTLAILEAGLNEILRAKASL